MRRAFTVGGPGSCPSSGECGIDTDEHVVEPCRKASNARLADGRAADLADAQTQVAEVRLTLESLCRQRRAVLSELSG